MKTLLRAALAGLWMILAANGAEAQFVTPGPLGKVSSDPLINFNAKGDGVTNDGAALQAAFNYAIANGLTVILPPGANYFTSQTLTFDCSTAPQINGEPDCPPIYANGNTITAAAGVTPAFIARCGSATLCGHFSLRGPLLVQGAANGPICQFGNSTLLDTLDAVGIEGLGCDNSYSSLGSGGAFGIAVYAVSSADFGEVFSDSSPGGIFIKGATNLTIHGGHAIANLSGGTGCELAGSTNQITIVGYRCQDTNASAGYGLVFANGTTQIALVNMAIGGSTWGIYETGTAPSFVRPTNIDWTGTGPNYSSTAGIIPSLALLCNKSANSHTGDTIETILGQCTLPPLPAGDFLKVRAVWSTTNNTDTKTTRIRFGTLGTTSDPLAGNTQVVISSATNNGLVQTGGIWTLTTGSQIDSFGNYGNGGPCSSGGNATACESTNVNTTGTSYLTFTGQLGTATDIISLFGATVEDAFGP